MTVKWLGVGLLVIGCGCVGFSMARSYRRRIAVLEELQDALLLMQGELSCRMTPLPELFYRVSRLQKGSLQKVFADLAEALEQLLSPEADDCMQQVLEMDCDLPEEAAQLLSELGRCMGVFDLAGQLQQLEMLRSRCAMQLESLNQQKEDRIRQYRTLGICAGAALAVLLI